MKSIENKETKIINVDETGKVIGNCLYSNLINLVIRQPKHGGYDYEDIEQRMTISKVIKEANGTIDLEDANFKYLKDLVRNNKWNFWHEDLLTFKEDIINNKS